VRVALSIEAFARRGVHVDPEALDRLLAASIAAVLPDAPIGSPAELTAAEVAALERGGLRPSPPREEVDRVLAGSAAELAALLGTAYSVAEAARLLGVHSSRVRHRLAARTLYGVRHAGGWRLPRFQFDGSRPVPGIERVFPQLEPGLHPLAVARWFTGSDPDLELDGVALSPRDWLLAGGAPDAVAALADDLTRGQ
jgi:hypothetical protein